MVALPQSVTLKLETEKINLLYKQNIQAVLGLVLFALAYSYLCGNLMSPTGLHIWLATVLLSAVARLIGSYRWRKKRSQFISVKQLQSWHLFIQFMMAVSGGLWGIAGWIGSRATDPIQQIVTAITVVFMAAGALVCWASSLRAMFIFILPAMLPWCLSYALSSDASYQLIGHLGFIYVFLGSRSGMMLNHYINRSLKLNVENTQLTNELQQEILVKARAEEALRLALSSSEAIEWRWNVENDEFICKGDLSRSFGMKTSYFSGCLDDIARLFYLEDREKFRAIMLQIALNGGELDTDLRISWPNGQIHDLAFRGKGQESSDSKITHLTGIAWDTTAQKSQSKLQQEKNAYEAANKAKSVFLANASHEIRTPLAAINGYVESLLQGISDPKELRSDLQAISRNGKFLASLVNDFLDLSKIESGHFYMQKGMMSPRHEIDESLQLIIPALEAKGLQLEVKYESLIPVSIESDPARFRQILVNLLSNAVKFTEAGKIKVSVHHIMNAQKDGCLIIQVKDTGIGLDDTTRKQLFEPFVRGQSAEVQRVYGSGLGLALSKNLAQILKGDLRLLSSQVGKGSEFEFVLNTGPAHLLKYPAKNTNDSPLKQLQNLKILVVDDAVDLRVLMRRYLEKHGAQVESCENGLEAVDKAFHQSFDIILMDIKMPIMDGHEATATLRKNGFKNAIVAITAHASVDDKQLSLQQGCDYYMSKPVDFAFLTDIIFQIQKMKNPEVSTL